MIFRNAANIPLNKINGTLPEVGDTMMDWFQPMVFGVVTKTVEGFQAVETETQINFQGVIQPLTERQLVLKPEGQRAWTWLKLHADPVLTLQVDSIVVWNGKQTRVMARKDFALYGFVEYDLVQDWTGSDPTVVTP